MRRLSLTLYLLVVALTLCGLGWVTYQSLAVEADQLSASARADAAQVERLALWQLDSRLVPAWSVENNRNYAHYFAFYTPFPVVAADGGNGEPVKLPSPIMAAELPEWMKLHFQLDRDAGWSSPQVVALEAQNRFRDHNPEMFNWGQDNIKTAHGKLLNELRNKYVSKSAHEQLMRWEKMNVDDSPLTVPYPLPTAPQVANPMPLQKTTDKAAMAEEVPDRGRPNDEKKAEPQPELPKAPAGRLAPFSQLSAGYDARNDLGKRAMSEVRNAIEAAPATAKPDDAGARPAETLQRKPGEAACKDMLAFEQAVTGSLGNGVNSGRIEEQVAANDPKVELKLDARKIVHTLVRPPMVQLGPMRPVWLNGVNGEQSLVLVRAAKLENRIVFQGVLLDWPKLREMLLAEVRPQLPEAKLEPATDAPAERRMTALPASLDPGPEPSPPPAGWTPLRIGLALGWLAALIALAGIGFAGWSLIDLNEQRIRFVSAVTHELRTPLTAMRLYTDLLVSGMIADEEKQKDYLRTLSTESERLNTLIENVLDFAKLEKRTVQAQCLPLPLSDLLAQVAGTWSDRLANEDRELVVVNELPPGTTLTTDARIAAQILGNLIDNARKYSRDADDKRIWLTAKQCHGRILIEVEDRGPGIPAGESQSIFRPFRRGKTENATGGAGLGLALAKQWASLLGGTLEHCIPNCGSGACFRLSLR